MLVVTCVLSIVLFDKSFSHIKAVDDKTKVENSNEIAIINITNKIDKKTYEVEIIDKLKGDDFSYIIIKDNKIDINISSNYLIFGNRLSKDSQYKNYVSYDVIEVYSPQYIQEIQSEDILNHPTVTYYKELIDAEPKEDVLVANLLNPRKEEYTITSKNIYDNPYDSFDLNEDFDIPFKDAYYEDYKYVDIKIYLGISGDNISKIIQIFSNDNTKAVSNLEEYKLILKNCKYYYKVVCLNFNNIDISTFDNNNKRLFVKYSYNYLFDASWNNCINNIKIIYRK